MNPSKRSETIRRIHSALGAGPRVTLVTGPAGIGRSTVLAEAARIATARGLTAIALPLTRHDLDVPYSAGCRIASAVSRLPVSVTAPPPGCEPAHPVVAELAALIRARPGLVIIIDDLHLTDDDSRMVFGQLARHLPADVLRWVCSARTPVGSGLDRLAEPGSAVVQDLLTEGLAWTAPLPPLSRAETDSLVAERLRATPHHRLSYRIHRLCRGIPAAVVAALESWRASGALQVVDGHAYLLPSAWMTFDAPARKGLDEPAEPARSVAKAVAVLHPVGDRLPYLIAEAYGLKLSAVWAGLNLLLAEGMLVRVSGGALRFAAPLWARLLRRSLAPYERGVLTRALVEAVWTGLRCPDPHLAEQLLHGGGAAYPERAFAELLRIGATAIRRDTVAASHWLAGATALAPNAVARWSALGQHAYACATMGDYGTALHNTEQVLQLSPRELDDRSLLNVALVHVVSLWNGDQHARLEQVADGELELGRRPGHRSICRALALTCLGRYNAAYQLLADDLDLWPDDDAAYAQILLAISGALTGRPGHLRELVARNSEHEHPGPLHVMLIRAELRTRLLLGDTARAERLLAREGLAADQLPPVDRLLLSSQAGRWDEALHDARMGIATHRPGKGDGGRVVHHSIAQVLLGRGRLTAARQAVAESRRTEPPALGHLCDLLDAAIAYVLGDDDTVRRLVRSGLATAQEHSLLAGTEELWLLDAQLAMRRQDSAQAHAALDAVSGIAERQQTDHSRLIALLTRMAVSPEPGSAATAVQSARRLGQPVTLSRTLVAAVDCGGDVALLQEAYELLEPVGALLYRYRLRGLMRRHGVPVPNRNGTVSENDRLLATLVADGASNREVATVLMTSCKSVEGMLARLFARTGYRSRVALAAAVLSGEFQTG